MKKTFNSTADGQKAMFYDASARSVVLMLHRKLESAGLSPFLLSQIESAPFERLAAMRDELIPIYNGLIRSRKEES